MDIFSGIGSLAGSIYSAEVAKRSAKEQMRFQERMSSTAHQREVEDLRAAGLNPILSAGGSGAQGAVGAGYSADSDMGSKAIASAKEVSLAKDQSNLMKAQEEAAASSKEVNTATAAKIRKETQILGPKATLMEKINEGLQNAPKAWDTIKKNVDEAAKPYQMKGHSPSIYRK